MATINIGENQEKYIKDDNAELKQMIDTVDSKICKTIVNIDNTRYEILMQIDDVNRKVCETNANIDNLRNKFLICVILTIASVVILAITSCLYMENKLDAITAKIKYQAEQIEDLEEEISGLQNNRETEIEKLQQEINILQDNLDFLNSLIRIKGE